MHPVSSSLEGRHAQASSLAPRNDRGPRFDSRPGLGPARRGAGAPGTTPDKPAAPTKPGELKKYDDVITKNAKTYPGVFIVHRIDDKVYFEIPKEGFDRLMLWKAEVAKGPAGVSWGGQDLGHHHLRWERRGNKVYLWQRFVREARRRQGDPGRRRFRRHGHHHLQLQRRGRGEGSIDRYQRHAALPVRHRRSVGEACRWLAAGHHRRFPLLLARDQGVPHQHRGPLAVDVPRRARRRRAGRRRGRAAAGGAGAKPYRRGPL